MNQCIEPFIFRSGTWIGEGTLCLPAVGQSIQFYTRWIIQEVSLQVFFATQVIEVEGIDEQVTNQWHFVKQQPDSFSVILESEQVGRITGAGYCEPFALGWEFPGDEKEIAVKGSERYVYQEGCFYEVQAKYGAAEPYCTLIEGKLWKKGCAGVKFN